MPHDQRPAKRMKTCDTAATSIFNPNANSLGAHCWWAELDRMVFAHPDPNNERDRKEMIGIYISLDDVHTCENAFGSHIGFSDEGKGMVMINYRYRSGMVINECLHVDFNNRNTLHRINWKYCSTGTVDIIRDPFGLIIGLKPFKNDAVFVRTS